MSLIPHLLQVDLIIGMLAGAIDCFRNRVVY